MARKKCDVCMGSTEVDGDLCSNINCHNGKVFFDPKKEKKEQRGSANSDSTYARPCQNILSFIKNLW